ncbi:MAG TPA: hypothetical protein V6C84_14545 [Coleofasciculaceae cyanobacterium]|jgi:putative transposase
MQTISPDSSVPSEEPKLEQQLSNPPMLLNEISSKIEQKIDLIDAILQAPDKKTRKDAIIQAAETLGKTTRTIRLMMEKVKEEGVAALAVGRPDAGKFRISDEWFKFIVKTYEWGRRDGSRTRACFKTVTTRQ